MEYDFDMREQLQEQGWSHDLAVKNTKYAIVIYLKTSLHSFLLYWWWSCYTRSMNLEMPEAVADFLSQDYAEGEIPAEAKEVAVSNPERHVYG